MNKITILTVLSLLLMFITGCSANMENKEDTKAPISAEVPTEVPLLESIEVPAATPTEKPTVAPTEKPMQELENIPVATEEPTMVPTDEPTSTPAPTAEPTSTPEPTEEPTSTPVPTEEPTSTPVPTEEPTSTPAPTAEPTSTPIPTEEPTPVHTHAYSSEVTIKPSCISEGEKNYTCACGFSYTEVVAKTEHNYTRVRTQPTCTEEGYDTWTCVCGDTYIGETHPAWGHEYLQNICRYCGALDPNHVHNYDDGICIYCGTSDPDYVHEHDYRSNYGYEEWTEPGIVVGGHALECYCGKQFPETTEGSKELHEHQDSVPGNGDTLCYTCGYVTPGGLYDPYCTRNEEYDYLVSNFCGSCGNYTVSSTVHCMGWGNGWSDTIERPGTIKTTRVYCKCGAYMEYKSGNSDCLGDSWILIGDPVYSE